MKLSEWQDAWNQLDAHSGGIGVMPDDNQSPCGCPDCEQAREIIKAWDSATDD